MIESDKLCTDFTEDSFYRYFRLLRLNATKHKVGISALVILV